MGNRKSFYSPCGATVDRVSGALHGCDKTLMSLLPNHHRVHAAHYIGRGERRRRRARRQESRLGADHDFVAVQLLQRGSDAALRMLAAIVDGRVEEVNAVLRGGEQRIHVRLVRRIIRLADKNNVVVVPFDNILDTDKVMMVNEDQKEMGRMSAKWLIDEMGKTSGTILEVRGLPGNSVHQCEQMPITNPAAASAGISTQVRITLAGRAAAISRLNANPTARVSGANTNACAVSKYDDRVLGQSRVG